jgi:protein required for attachment to host cells
MRVPHEARVMVADGAKMLFFRNEGDSDYPALQLITGQEQPDPADRDIKSDAAGRTAGPNGRGSALGEANFHEQAEQRFLAEAAEVLNKSALAGDYDSLIVVAPPRALGELRKHYRSEVESRLIDEIAKDLTGYPVDQIEQILVGIGKD